MDIVYIPLLWDVPYYNFALEEYLLESKKHCGNYLFFYVHRPSVIIGAHQNAYKEVNAAYLEENKIILARRISGGGAVYHDSGNLNYSIILNEKEKGKISLDRFSEHIIRSLKRLGADCTFTGRNDILYEGRKISGSAQCIKEGRLLHHATIMYDVDIEKMSAALSPAKAKLTAKGVDSVKSRVGNLKQALCGAGIEEIKSEVIKEIAAGETLLDEEDISIIRKKVLDKFSRRQYNYGEKKDFGIEKTCRTEAGTISARVLTDGTMIKDVCLTGDFFVTGDISLTVKELIGADYSIEGITGAVKDSRIFGFSVKDLAELLLR